MTHLSHGDQREARADFLARLEYGLNPVIAHYGVHAKCTEVVGSDTFLCENRNGPGGAGNTTRSLTHSSGTSREGLA